MSKFRSNVSGLKGTETITGFATISADAITSTAALTSGTYLMIGLQKYIFVGQGVTANSASIVAVADALVATPIKGSLYLGDANLWQFDSDVTATKVT